ncbi:MAG: tRNA-dihydrouridine synthase [Patescibacteria group bacterium]
MLNFWDKLTKPIIALAPMAGVTDQSFRWLCKDFGADVIYTEFASSNGLIYQNKKTREMLKFSPAEQPVVCQIFGNNPEIFYKSASILQEMGFAGLDINFGCPSYKVVKNGGGVSLMRQPNLCAELVQAACEGSSLPVSIKLRASIKNNNKDGQTITAVDVIKKMVALPISAIMLHARSYEKPFDGELQMEIFKQARQIWKKVLLFNGGITTPENAQQIITETGADGLGIARGSLGRPWLFAQIKSYLKTRTYKSYYWPDIKKIILCHAALALKHKGDYGLIELRKHLSWYIRGFPGASNLRSKLVQVKVLADIKSILK